MKQAVRLATFVVALAACASDARADGWISPFAGVNFGGDAGGRFEDVIDERKQLTWGFDVGWMGAGVFGAELDFSYTDKFFNSEPSAEANHVMTLLPTLLIGIPVGGQAGAGIRPFLSGGIGLVQRDLSVGGIPVYDNENSWAYTFGGGLMGFFTDHFGVRGDYRYLRAFTADDFFDLVSGGIEEGTFNYSRGSLGLIFRF